MSKKVIIHVGTHKTGTTAIQQALKYTASRESDPGFHYITAKDIFRKISKVQMGSNHNTLDELTHELCNCLSEEVEEVKPDAEVFIISYEGFSGNPLSGYANAHAIAQIISVASKRVFSQVEVVIYIRRQDAFVESLYTQYIHQGQSWSFSRFLDRFDGAAFDWNAFCSIYESAFGLENTHIRSYDRQKLVNNELVDDFSSVTDLTIIKSPVKKINQGYSREALEIARICNSRFTSDEKKKLRKLLQATNTKQLFSSYGFFSSVERAKFLSHYEESNTCLAEKINTPYLFSEAGVDNEECNDFSGLDVKTLAVVAMRALIN